MLSASVAAIFGATCSGKTTLCREMKLGIESAQLSTSAAFRHVKIISQDDFYKVCESWFSYPVSCLISRFAVQPDGAYEKIQGFDNWESPDGIDFAKLNEALQAAVQTAEPSTLILVEGHLLQQTNFIISQVSKCLYLTLSAEECRDRRMKRDPWLQENPTYFDICIWPMHQKYCLDIIQTMDESKLHILDATEPLETVQAKALAVLRLLSPAT